ncbi:MAG: twin-arginine translocation signal domain-containing protein [Planctomycetaceae bacterium]
MTDSLSRRGFLGASGAGVLGTASAAELCAKPQAAEGSRKKMAIVTTVWRYLSHAQHMGDRFLVGYPMDGAWNRPKLDVVSLYVDQKPKEDLSRARAKEFGCTLHPTIAQALRRGGKTLAVDAVLIIGEHGNYKRNDIGQKMYPRYEFFTQVADVFEKDGKSVPVFSDKHLSWKWDWAKRMVQRSRKLRFPFMAGSSLPVTWRMPSVDLPHGADVEEMVSLAMGGVDSYDFHALEVMQCMAERRRGGETGVQWVQALRGDAFWKAMRAGSFPAGGWNAKLFEACLTRSHTLVQPRAGFNHRHPTPREIQTAARDPVAYRIQYRDGTRGTMLLMNGVVRDFTFAATLKGESEPLSTLFYLPPTPNVQYSAILMSNVEHMFLTGKTAYPVERTLLTSGMLEASIQSLAKKGEKLATPHLAVKYGVGRQSTFCRR